MIWNLTLSESLFVLLILLVVAERGLEMLITRRNAARLLARGGRAEGDAHFPWMVILHAGLLIAAPLEAVVFDRPFLPALGWPMFGVVIMTMGLRYWAITTLGDRWTTRVFVVPGEPPVTGGPYRYLRHPNYLAVILEVAALPLIHTAWWTATVVSLGNAWVLWTRIRVEETALEQASSYHEALGDRSPLLPSSPTRRQKS